MGEFLGYLQRLNVRPDIDALTNADRNQIEQHFDPYASEVVMNGTTIDWSAIEEIEVAQAARASDPSGWLVRQMYGGERFHVGVYYGPYETVLTNLTRQSAEYVVRSIAFYAPQPVRYSGVAGLSPVE